MTKQNLLKYIDELPEQFSIDELMDKILFIHKMELGLQQSKDNQVTSHEEVKEQFKKWLK